MKSHVQSHHTGRYNGTTFSLNILALHSKFVQAKHDLFGTTVGSIEEAATLYARNNAIQNALPSYLGQQHTARRN